MCSYTLNVWDVGGQRTLRPYWRNYFEATDAVVWVVDSSDRMRTGDCKSELKELLQEDVSPETQRMKTGMDEGADCAGCGRGPVEVEISRSDVIDFRKQAGSSGSDVARRDPRCESA